MISIIPLNNDCYTSPMTADAWKFSGILLIAGFLSFVTVIPAFAAEGIPRGARPATKADIPLMEAAGIQNPTVGMLWDPSNPNTGQAAGETKQWLQKHATTGSNVSCFNPEFAVKIKNLMEAVPGGIPNITSGYRGQAAQESAYARRASQVRWCEGYHNYGMAADFNGASAQTLQWMRVNAPRFGLSPVKTLNPMTGCSRIPGSKFCDAGHIEELGRLPSRDQCGVCANDKGNGILPGGGGRSAPSSPLSTAIRNAVNPQPAMQSPPAQPLPQQLPQQTPTASAPPPLGTPNTTPYQPGTCAPQFYCSNNNLYYRTSSCVDQINQVCTKGCSGTSCIDTPVSTDLLTALLSTSTRPATTTGKKTATATPSVFEQLSAFAGPTVVTVTTNVATSVDLTGLYGQGVMTLNGVPQTQTAPGTPGNSYQLAPPGSQQTFISPDLGQSAGTYTNPPQQSTFQKTLADMKAVVLRILEYLRPFGRSGGVDNYPESE